MYESPAVPPTLMTKVIRFIILNAEYGKHYYSFTLAAQRRVHDASC